MATRRSDRTGRTDKSINRLRRGLTVAMLVVLALPLFAVDDGVPLSSYPMYARPRSDTLTFVAAVGLDDAGEAVSLSTQTIADTRDPLIAETWLRNEVSAGRADQACGQISDRAGDRVVAIELRREQHRVVDRARGDESLVTSTEIVRCER